MIMIIEACISISVNLWLSSQFKKKEKKSNTRHLQLTVQFVFYFKRKI